jgi:hypothetical protein
MAIELLVIATIIFTAWLIGLTPFWKSGVAFLGVYFAEFVSVCINKK